MVMPILAISPSTCGPYFAARAVSDQIEPFWRSGCVTRPRVLVKSIAVAMVEPKPAGIGAEPPAPLLANWGVGDRRAATLSDGLPDVPASGHAVFRVDRRPDRQQN